MDKKNHLKNVKHTALNLFIKGVIVAGFVLAPTNKAWLNFVTLAHWWFWFCVAIYIIAIIIIPICYYLVKTHKAIKTDGLKEATKDMEDPTFKLYFWFNKAVNIPFLIYVGVLQSDWSLFIPLLLCEIFSFFFMGINKSFRKFLYRNTGDGDGYGEGEKEGKDKNVILSAILP